MSIIPVYHISSYIGYREIINIPMNDLLIELTKENTEKSYYEILNGNVKLYFDIEQIPFEEPDLIYEIIERLIKFIKDETNIEITKYVLTEKNPIFQDKNNL